MSRKNNRGDRPQSKETVGEMIDESVDRPARRARHASGTDQPVSKSVSAVKSRKILREAEAYGKVYDQQFDRCTRLVEVAYDKELEMRDGILLVRLMLIPLVDEDGNPMVKPEIPIPSNTDIRDMSQGMVEIKYPFTPVGMVIAGPHESDDPKEICVGDYVLLEQSERSFKVSKDGQTQLLNNQFLDPFSMIDMQGEMQPSAENFGVVRTSPFKVVARITEDEFHRHFGFALQPDAD